MALGDITLKENSGSNGGKGAKTYNVASSATLIYAGEPVAVNAVGDVVVIPMATSNPTCSTTAGVEGKFVGIASTTSTNTASAAGTVQVIEVDPSMIYLISPKTAASWDTQSEYDALTGKRVTIDLTSSSYTLNATDSANNGCIVRPLDISKYPGKVAISFRIGTSVQQ